MNSFYWTRHIVNPTMRTAESAERAVMTLPKLQQSIFSLTCWLFTPASEFDRCVRTRRCYCQLGIPRSTLESNIRSLKINSNRFKITDLSLEHLVLVRTWFSSAPRGELCCRESHQLADSRQFCGDSMTLFSVVYDWPRGCLPIGE